MGKKKISILREMKRIESLTMPDHVNVKVAGSTAEEMMTPIIRYR